MVSRLPPLRPLHPAWPMVATIGFFGAALTSLLAGNRPMAIAMIAIAAAWAAVSGRTIRSARTGRSRTP
jgi:hypothetical protein